MIRVRDITDEQQDKESGGGLSTICLEPAGRAVLERRGEEERFAEWQESHYVWKFQGNKFEKKKCALLVGTSNARSANTIASISAPSVSIQFLLIGHGRATIDGIYVSLFIEAAEIPAKRSMDYGVYFRQFRIGIEWFEWRENRRKNAERNVGHGAGMECCQSDNSRFHCRRG